METTKTNAAEKIEKFYHFNADNRIIVGYESTIDDARKAAIAWNRRNKDGDKVAFIGNNRVMIHSTRLTVID